MRSKLFVPGSRPELYAKAMAGPADALSFDLEDSVDESRKDEARQALAGFLRSLPPNPGKVIIVRVNGLNTPHFEADLEAIVGPRLDYLNLPKPESAFEIRACVAALEKVERQGGHEPIKILANIESPKALRLAAEIATASPRVAGLQIGWGDLIEPLGIDRYNLPVIEAIQLAIRVAAGEAGIWAYDGAFANFKNLDGYRQRSRNGAPPGLHRQECHSSDAGTDRERGVSPVRCSDRACPPRRGSGARGG